MKTREYFYEVTKRDGNGTTLFKIILGETKGKTYLFYYMEIKSGMFMDYGMEEVTKEIRKMKSEKEISQYLSKKLTDKIMKSIENTTKFHEKIGKEKYAEFSKAKDELFDIYKKLFGNRGKQGEIYLGF